jgi:hypothetical protein
MTNPTSNFGWQMPTPTDLVTDLPADFEVFGQAVDTSMADLKGGTSGQILSKASNTDMDFTWITNDVGDITNIAVTSPITGGGSSGSVTIGVDAASTSASGVVQLSDSTSTTSSVLASTPTATKAAYDLAAAAVPKSTVTTAGDVIYATGSGAVTRLGIGTTGQVLTVNGGGTAPSWATPASGANAFYAGKNKVINGDMYINQRNFTSNTTTGTYGFDRFKQANSGGTYTVTPQTFALGTAPVSGYEGKNFCRLVTASQSAAGDYAALEQMIESVRTFAGQTVTFSCWAKASTGTPKIGFSTVQFFGTGGSPSANVITSGGTATISTAWARYSFTVAVPSIAGKTIGTNNDDKVQLDLWTSVGTTISGLGYPAVGLQNVTIDTWGWQLEAGSTATDFQTASGSLQGELALCQRYYVRTLSTQLSSNYGFGLGNSSTQTYFQVQIPEMRTTPTVIDYSLLEASDGANNTAFTSLVINSGNSTARVAFLIGGHSSGITQYRPYILRNNASTSGYLGLGAEL